MKRRSTKSNVKKHFPFTWCKCVNCNEEFKFEKMWVAVCLERGLDTKNYYLCKECASNEEEAIQTFVDNDIKIDF